VEIGVERNPETAYARFQEPEADDAHAGAPVERINLGSTRHKGSKQSWIDGVVKDREHSPLRRQKGAHVSQIPGTPRGFPFNAAWRKVRRSARSFGSFPGDLERRTGASEPSSTHHQNAADSFSWNWSPRAESKNLRNYAGGDEWSAQLRR